MSSSLQSLDEISLQQAFYKFQLLKTSLVQASGAERLESLTRPKKMIVFVHGIRSNHETFEPLLEKLTKLGVSAQFEFAYYNYNYRRSISDSGADLAEMLIRCFGEEESEITLVGHSMGGLVCRLALLQRGDEMPFVKRLIMLGTPNHGTLHTGKMGMLAQTIREFTGKIWVFTTRKTGVKELTEVRTLMKPHLNDNSQRRTLGVDYVTLPATCFHEGAGIGTLLTGGKSRKMALVPLIMEILSAHPGARIGLDIPHDGIVEEASVYMGDRTNGTRRSERKKTCEKHSGCGPYVHVRHDDLTEESHVTIQEADCTASIIAGILDGRDLETWRADTEKIFEFTIEP